MIRTLSATLFLLLLSSLALAASQGAGYETRCGWVENPTPANWYLLDKDGEWLIWTMGGYQAEGDDNIPEFPESKAYWKVTNAGQHGYGCGCLKVKADKKEMKILEIQSGKVLPLSKCKADPALKKPQ